MVVSSVCWDQLRLGSLSPFLIRCNASYFKGTVFGVNPMTWSCWRRPLLTGEWERRWLWLQRGSSHENARRERHEAPATLDGHLLWKCNWSLGVPGVDWLLRAKTANKIICSLAKPLVSLQPFLSRHTTFLSYKTKIVAREIIKPQQNQSGNGLVSSGPHSKFRLCLLMLSWADGIKAMSRDFFGSREGAGKTSDKIQQLKKCDRVCLF